MSKSQSQQLADQVAEVFPSSVPAGLPRFKCHKVVHAVKIHEFIQQADACYLVPEERAHRPFPISAEYIGRCKPKAGGYYVRYDDGYESFSPAAAFESGYTRIAE